MILPPHHSTFFHARINLMNKAFWILYFFFCCFFFIFFSSGIVDSQDGLQYLAISRRMYYDHTFEMPDPDFPEENIHMSISKTADGKRYSPTGLGYSLALLPAVAVEEVFLRAADLTPLEAFPLESDWPVLLVASMTNAIFGAGLCVILGLYLQSFEVSRKTSAMLSFLLLISSNLFPYTKHVFAHMMFVMFLTLSFYLLRRYKITKNIWNIFFAGLSFGVVIISYNPTFLLAAPALGLYYLFNIPQKFEWKKSYFIRRCLEMISGVAGVIPGMFLYSWFNSVRFGGATSTGYGEGGIPLPPIPPLNVFFEGSWSLLLSPGKSIFLFSPLLLLLVFFWHKLDKRYLPEIITFGVLFLVYYLFTATLMGGVDYPLWHGESSWGPRYMLPVLPGLLLLVGIIIAKLNSLQKWFIVFPLVLMGIWIQLCGMLLPYQIRFAGLTLDTTFNGRNWNLYEYGNLIPRYSPVFTMSKVLAKRIYHFDRLFDRGTYGLILQDGFERPFRPTPDTVWREIHPPSILTVQLPEEQENQFEMILANHQNIPESSYSAVIKILMNSQEVIESSISAGEEKTIAFTLPKQSKQLTEIRFEPSFTGTTSASLPKRQIVFLKSLIINHQRQNLFLIDYPFVSPISQQLYDSEYTYYGNVQNDAWELWHMRSGVYEETFDLWWLRPVHYWDLPPRLFALLFVINISGILVCGAYLIRSKDILKITKGKHV